MCKFFSLVSDGHGKIFYFNNESRRKIISGELEYEADSHTSIADYFGFKGEREDKLNKYDYNPFKKELTLDTLNTKDDSESVKKQCLELDFKNIVPELIIKDIINPKNIMHSDTVTDLEIELLLQWISVRDSVWNSVGNSVGCSVWNSVWNSVGNSVGDLAGDSVRYSVWDSVWDSVRDSVWVSVGASVGDSVWVSVRDSVWAYTSSFFIITNWKYIDYEVGKNPFQSCIDLLNLGLVPSFDGKTWRLHNMSNNAKIIYEYIK